MLIDRETGFGFDLEKIERREKQAMGVHGDSVHITTGAGTGSKMATASVSRHMKLAHQSTSPKRRSTANKNYIRANKQSLRGSGAQNLKEVKMLMCDTYTKKSDNVL